MKNILPWTAAALSCALFFGAGFFTGRLLPAHRYERLSETMLFDTTTGKPCMVQRVIGFEQATPSQTILQADPIRDYLNALPDAGSGSPQQAAPKAASAAGAIPTTQFSSGVNEVDANPHVPSCGH